MNIKTGVELIAEERVRQIAIEGWTAGDDDRHNEQQLAKAAACYALPQLDRLWIFGPGLLFDSLWPWARSWWKPTQYDRKRELAKAGALCAAEIDRLQRLEAASK